MSSEHYILFGPRVPFDRILCKILCPEHPLLEQCGKFVCSKYPLSGHYVKFSAQITLCFGFAQVHDVLVPKVW